VSHSFGSSSYQERQKKACRENLRKIFVAMQIYADDNNGTYPLTPGAKTSEEPLSMLVPRYTVDTGSFICPGSKDSRLPSGEPFARRRISYAYFMGLKQTNGNQVLMSDRQINTLPKKEGDQVFSTAGKPPANNHYKYGGNYIFVDGHLDTSGATAPFSLVWTRGVVMLNPKP
jgi:hypothetical protein